VITTSKRVLGSKVSTARASGMIHPHRRAALGHLLAGLDDQPRDPLSLPLADPAHHVEANRPALLLLRGGPADLRAHARRSIS